MPWRILDSRNMKNVVTCICAFNDNQSVMKQMGHNEIRSMGHRVHFYCINNVEETEQVWKTEI